MMPNVQVWTNTIEFQTVEASIFSHIKQQKVRELLKNSFQFAETIERTAYRSSII